MFATGEKGGQRLKKNISGCFSSHIKNIFFICISISISISISIEHFATTKTMASVLIVGNAQRGKTTLRDALPTTIESVELPPLVSSLDEKGLSIWDAAFTKESLVVLFVCTHRNGRLIQDDVRLFQNLMTRYRIMTSSVVLVVNKTKSQEWLQQFKCMFENQASFQFTFTVGLSCPIQENETEQLMSMLSEMNPCEHKLWTNDTLRFQHEIRSGLIKDADVLKHTSKNIKEESLKLTTSCHHLNKLISGLSIQTDTAHDALLLLTKQHCDLLVEAEHHQNDLELYTKTLNDAINATREQIKTKRKGLKRLVHAVKTLL